MNKTMTPAALSNTMKFDMSGLLSLRGGHRQDNAMSEWTPLFLDKNPQLSDFISQIKAIPELQIIYEFLLKDSATVLSQDSNLMDLC